MPNFTDSTPVGRIASIDTLRGFALLGILLINIQGFAMVSAAYVNPAAYGDLTGWNYLVWFGSYIFADSKFLALFSLLFGASLLLIQQQAAKNMALEDVWRYHLRRLLILFVIGMLHAYLIWPGDILVTYAICGVILLTFHTWRARELFLVGLLMLSIPSWHMYQLNQNMRDWDKTELLRSQLEWQPPAADYQTELAAYRGNWARQQSQRTTEAINMQTESVPGWLFWRVSGLMLLGMALFRLGILTGQRSARFYRNMTLAGLGLGLPPIIWSTVAMTQTHWSFDYFVSRGYQINYWASLLVMAGYIGLIMRLCQTLWAGWITALLANVGRMALSNYLLQSLLCTFIFYGHGLGMFGHIERVGQFLIVLAVSLAQIAFSTWWLKHFRYGPVEWLWRSATHQCWQPFRANS